MTHPPHDGAITPWWADPPPWVCRRCFRTFTDGSHFRGKALCPDPACSRLCRRCFLLIRVAREIGAEVPSPDEYTIIDAQGTRTFTDEGVDVDPTPVFIPRPEDDDGHRA